MKTMDKFSKRYVINDLIELRLVEKETKIFVANQEFRSCKYILLNIPKVEVYERDYISIDELKNQYSNKHEGNREIEGLTAEVEFFAHCSNLEAWINENYNPNVLHSNLSVPLLKELIKYDVRVLNALLYHLDDYWNSYESDYDNRFTQERRMLLIEQYKEIIYDAIEHYELNQYELLSEFVLMCRLFDALPKMFPLAQEQCEICEKYYLKGRMEFYTYRIYHDTNDDTYYDEQKVCQNCSDNSYPYEYDIEYCSHCDKYFYLDRYRGNYAITDSEIYCLNCYREIVLESGFQSDYNDIRLELSFDVDELKSNKWKYVITHYSEGDLHESIDYLRDLDVKYLVIDEKSCYSTINEYALFIKS